jgi:TrmH family RNA methyltransferase
LRKRSLRASEQSLVVEGAELLSAAYQSGAPIESVYVAPEGRANPAVASVVGEVFASGVRVFDLGPGVIERVSDTVSPQPVLAVVGFAPGSPADLEQASMVVVCVDVRDPGNVGTMIRTADAAGVDAVVCCDGTVDPTNPKTVRASAGSLFHVPVVAGGDAGALVGQLRAWGMTAVGAEVRGGTDYASFDWRQRVALVFGNEASGLDASVGSRLDRWVSIPMVGGAESLNVSVSAAVLCFEALRQRRGSGEPRTPSPAPGALRPTMPGMHGAPAGPREPGSGGTGGVTR